MSDTIPHEFDPPLTTCPLCQSTQLRPYDRDYRGITIDRCDNCRLQFMNPQYTDRYMASLYTGYINAAVDDDTPYRRRRTMAKSEAFRLIGSLAKPGRFLAVGCGDGLELELAQQHGWEAEGYDVDAKTTRRVSQKLGVPVRTGDFFDARWPSEHYGCVFMDQVLEHPKNPQDYLREVHRILRPGGVLFIGCPNIRSISSAGKTLLGKLHMRKRRGRHYDTWHHLFYYSPQVLSEIVQRYYGFQTLVLEGDPFTGQTGQTNLQVASRRPFNWLARRVPMLESTFRLICRKPVASSAQLPRHAA